MRFHAILVGAVLAALNVTTVSAEVRIRHDPGGPIARHLAAFSRLRDSGQRVVIDGPCLSACTLVLAVMPRDRICATPRAQLGFHAAWVPGPDGRPIASAIGNDMLWSAYPGHVRRWITRRGGLSRKLIVARGRELRSLVPTCR